MARPSFGKGRYYAELLVSALLAYTTSELEIKMNRQLFIKFVRTDLVSNALRVKAEPIILVNLIKAYIATNCLPFQQEEIALKFTELTTLQQETEIKNIITCLISLKLAHDERAKGTNEKKRDFLLLLKHSPFNDSQRENNLTWLFKEWEKALAQQKKPLLIPSNQTDINSSPNSYIELVNNFILTVAGTFPEELYAYTLSKIEDLTPIIPTLKAIALNHSENLSEDSFKIFLSLIRFCIATGKLDEAHNLLEISDNYLTKTSKDFDLEIAQRQHYLGVVYFQKGQYQEAEQCFIKEYNIRCQIFGDNHLDLAETIHSLGAVHLVTKRYEQAKQYFQQAITLRQNEESNYQKLLIANSLNGIADTLYEQQFFNDAIRVYNMAIELVLKFSNNNAFLASSKIGIANINARLGNYEIARNLYQEAIFILEKVYGNKHPELAKPIAALGAVYCQYGQTEKGKEYYQQAIQLLINTFGEHHPLIALYQTDLLAWD